MLDANAALNMLHVFTEEALRGARLVEYTVEYQQHQQQHHQQRQPSLNAHVPNEDDAVREGRGRNLPEKGAFAIATGKNP
jgi:hypothetical protein